MTRKPKPKAENNHGTATAINVSKTSKGLSFNFTFEEALKLGLSLQSAVLSINRSNRATKAGKNHGVKVWIPHKQDDKEITFRVWDVVISPK
jgi:hypothetical protein